MIVLENVTVTIRITVCNYGLYDPKKETLSDNNERCASQNRYGTCSKTDTISERLSNGDYDNNGNVRNANETQMKRKRNADETEVAPTEEGNKVKKQSKNTYSPDFEQAWKNHGRQDSSKKKAFDSWSKLIQTGKHPGLAEIISAQDRQKLSKKWKEGFCPYFETWLNGWRWEEGQPNNGNKSSQFPHQATAFDSLSEKDQTLWMDEAKKRRPELAELEGAIKNIAAKLHCDSMKGTYGAARTENDPPASN
jgi:hypothetical protein